MTQTSSSKPIIKAYRKMVPSRTPLWLMRQAGRYLPEYREIRARSGGFLDLVYAPDLAADITMQPVRRFGMDAAILFSDILVIPHALGQKLAFLEGEGSKLDPIRGAADLSRLSHEKFIPTLSPIYETVRQTRALMSAEGFDDTALIGFSGSPWTLACYMIEGGASRDFIHAKSWAYHDPQSFQDLMDILTQAIIDYCLAQIEAGAEAIQLFESWAGVLDHNLFTRFVVRPTRKIVESIREVYPDVPIVGFPRGAGRLALDYAQNTTVNVLALDQQTAPKWAASVFQNLLPVQGNLDPVCLLTGGLAMEAAVEDILSHLARGPFVFNLGHGVIKETPVQHVEDLVSMVRAWS